MYMPPPPKPRPDPISPRAYALLKGRTYPEPLRYLASWSLVRHYASFPPATPEMWAEVFASLDAQRCTVGVDPNGNAWPRWDGVLTQ